MAANAGIELTGESKGSHQYRWRFGLRNPVDQDELDSLLQNRRDQKAVKKSVKECRKLSKKTLKIVTEKLKSYSQR